MPAHCGRIQRGSMYRVVSWDCLSSPALHCHCSRWILPLVSLLDPQPAYTQNAKMRGMQRVTKSMYGNTHVATCTALLVYWLFQDFNNYNTTILNWDISVQSGFCQASCTKSVLLFNKKTQPAAAYHMVCLCSMCWKTWTSTVTKFVHLLVAALCVLNSCQTAFAS